MTRIERKFNLLPKRVWRQDAVCCLVKKYRPVTQYKTGDMWTVYVYEPGAIAYIFIIASYSYCREYHMGEAQAPDKVKRFCAVMFSPHADVDVALDALKQQFGAIESSYGPINFGYTDYYAGEMGKNLQKLFLTFGGHMDRDDLPASKNFTNEVERGLAESGKRTVNLDPGYIARDKLVLATTKDFFHRLYLADGIYGEVTLHYRFGKFRYFSWTYADYKEPAFQEFLEQVRGKLVGELRKNAQ